jgi:hypothetical protein
LTVKRLALEGEAGDKGCRGRVNVVGVRVVGVWGGGWGGMWLLACVGGGERLTPASGLNLMQNRESLNTYIHENKRENVGDKRAPLVRRSGV